MDAPTTTKMDEAIDQMQSSDAKTQRQGVNNAHGLTRGNATSCALFADNARLLERLVFFQKQANNSSNQKNAHYALSNIASAGELAQLKIAQALDGDALSAMETMSDTRLREMLVKNPSAEALLAAKQGKQFVTALLEDACTTTDAVRHGAMIDTLVAIVEGSMEMTDGISTAEAEEVLLELCLGPIGGGHRDRVWQWVLGSVESVADHIRVAATSVIEDQTTAMLRRRAVLWLAHAIQVDTETRRAIVAGGGVAALVAELERETFLLDAKSPSQARSRSTDETKRQIVSALAIVTAEVNARTEVIALGGLESLLAFYKTSVDSDTMLALQALEQFMADGETHGAIMIAGGIPLVVRDLPHGELTIATLDALRELHVFSEPLSEHAPMEAVECSGDNKRITELTKLCHCNFAPELRSTAKRRLQDLTGMIPSLLRVLDLDALCALAIMAEAPTNCKAIVQAGGIPALGELVRGSRLDLKAVAIRVVANLCYQSDENCKVIFYAGLLDQLIQLFKHGNDGDVLEAAAKALHNLSNDEVNRTKIGTSGVIPRAVDLIKSADSFQLREVAVGMLGNLARQNHRMNQRSIALCGGVTAMVEFARVAETACQRQTGTTALWVLVEENGDCCDQFIAADGIRAIEHVEQLHEPQSESWAKRVLAMVRPIVPTRS